MENRGSEHGIGARLDCRRKIRGFAGAARSDNRDLDFLADSFDHLQIEALLGAIGIH